MLVVTAFVLKQVIWNVVSKQVEQERRDEHEKNVELLNAVKKRALLYSLKPMNEEDRLAVRKRLASENSDKE